MCGRGENDGVVITLHHINGRKDNRNLQIVCWDCHKRHNIFHGVYGRITTETIGRPELTEYCNHEFTTMKQVKLTRWECCAKCGELIAIIY